ncbi:hypothetical protein ACFL2T_08090 [Elusimicrobiota bacterium]
MSSNRIVALKVRKRKRWNPVCPHAYDAYGLFTCGAAVIQSMYSPELAAHSSGFELRVVE